MNYLVLALSPGAALVTALPRLSSWSLLVNGLGAAVVIATAFAIDLHASASTRHCEPAPWEWGLVMGFFSSIVWLGILILVVAGAQHLYRFIAARNVTR